MVANGLMFETGGKGGRFRRLSRLACFDFMTIGLPRSACVRVADVASAYLVSVEAPARCQSPEAKGTRSAESNSVRS